MGFSQTQLRVLAALPRIMAPLSMIGSGFIVNSTLRDVFENKAGTYQRLLLSFSCMDFITSFAMAMATWPIPEGTPGVWAPGGNTATCTAQGFFMQSIVTCPLYNGSLAVYYLLSTRFGWSQEQISKIEVLLHGVPLTVGFGTAFAGLFLKLYNNSLLWCWIAPFPLGCKSSFTYGDDANCVRGDNAMLYRWPFMYGPVWASIITATACMVLIYCSVLQQERDVDKYQHDGLARRTRSKRVAWQALWYLVAFLLSWMPASMNRIIQAITGGSTTYTAAFLHSLFSPFQGFMNFLVYFRSKYLKYRRDHPKATARDAMRKAAFAREVEEEADTTENKDTTFERAMQQVDGEMEDSNKSEVAHSNIDYIGS